VAEAELVTLTVADLDVDDGFAELEAATTIEVIAPAVPEPGTAGAAGAAKAALDSRRAIVQEARLIILMRRPGQDARAGPWLLNSTRDSGLLYTIRRENMI